VTEQQAHLTGRDTSARRMRPVSNEKQNYVAGSGAAPGSASSANSVMMNVYGSNST
jgi:hypothetical protein